LIEHARKLGTRTTARYERRWAALLRDNDEASAGSEHFIYVVDIQPLKLRLPPGLYVGSTSRTPELRLAAHRAGGEMAAAIFRPRGKGARYEAKGLLDEYVANLPAWRSRGLSQRAERILARELKARGHHVVCDRLKRTRRRRRPVEAPSLPAERLVDELVTTGSAQPQSRRGRN